VVSFTVAGLPAGAPTNVELDMTMTHTWVGDLDATLVGPGGSPSHVIFASTGATTSAGVGDSSNLGGLYSFKDSAAGVNWWQAAATAGPDALVPAGDYRTTAAGPQGTVNNSPVTNMTAAFAGVANPNGTWTLTVSDNAGLDTGSVSAATLRLTTGGGACPSPTPTPTPTPTPSVTPTPAPFSITFTQQTYVEDESQTAVIGINRSGDLSGTNTVNFATSNGTATGGAAPGAGVDYQTVNQNVTFNPGETFKTVNVPIFGDTFSEPTETVLLTLTGFGTAAQPDVQNAVLNINDTANLFRSAGAICSNLGGAADVYPSTITVAGGPVQIGNMRVTLYDLEHVFPDHLDVLLVGPGGQEFVLMGDAGGAISIPSNNTVTLSFRDAGPGVLPNGGPLMTGQFEPTTWESPVTNFPAPAPPGPYNEPGSTIGGTGSQTLFGTFGLTNSNGQWRLYVRDDAGAPLPGGDAVTGCFNGGWGIEFLTSTAANASISGRVLTAGGNGIRNAEVVISGGTLTEPMRVQTGSFGYYSFDGLQTGQTYMITVNSRRYLFTTPTRVVSLTDNIADLDFIAVDTGTTND
jgi:subtilisin-like proprotein convertase family protein